MKGHGRFPRSAGNINQFGVFDKKIYAQKQGPFLEEV
jgi:hypothetical protein